MAKLPDPPQPTVDAIYEAIERREAEKPRRPPRGISASYLGTECDRALFYELRWASPPPTFPGRILRIFDRGDEEERRVLRDLRDAGLEIDEQARFTAANGFIRGRADGICTGVKEAPAKQHVLEIKSAKASDWRAVKRHGLAGKKPLHWHQLHAGMASLGIDRGLYVMVNKDTEEILTERIKLDPEEAAKQEARVTRIVETHDAPGRINDDPKSFACRFCKHREVCHEQRWPSRHCRSCLHFSFTRDGVGNCARFDHPLLPDRQEEGCPAHLYLPALVPGEQVDADMEAETVTYEMPDGSTWVDGGGSNETS